MIWNHCIALHKRYYRMYGKPLDCAKLQAHIAKRRKRNPYWMQVGSQAVQDICQRIERAYHKTVTIKRSPVGELYLVVMVEAGQAGDPKDDKIKVATGKTAGFDFGLRQFLTCSEECDHDVTSPQFFRQSLKKLQCSSRSR